MKVNHGLLISYGGIIINMSSKKTGKEGTKSSTSSGTTYKGEKLTFLPAKDIKKANKHNTPFLMRERERERAYLVMSLYRAARNCFAASVNG